MVEKRDDLDRRMSDRLHLCPSAEKSMRDVQDPRHTQHIEIRDW